MALRLTHTSRLRTLLAGALSLGITGLASGAVIIQNTQDLAPAGGAAHDPYNPSAFTASGSDLAEGLIATTTGNDIFESSAGVSALTNGSIATVYAEGGPGGDAIDHAAYATVTTQTELTFDLGGLYNLSQIDIYAGWNDSGRDDFSFELRVSADGVGFSTIADYNKGGDDTGAFTTPVTNLHRIVDDGGADIASGVRYVQIWTYDADNGAAGVAEIDIFGQPVPEPGSIALLLVGSLGMLRRRR